MTFTKAPFLRNKILILLLVVVGFVFRIYHIDFGLPHSFHADEPEIAEFAIKYTYEFRSIVKNSDYYKLIPVSYVYGTVPAYLFTVATMFFSKISNIVGGPFTKTTLYIFMRSLNSMLSLLLIPLTMKIYSLMFPSKNKISYGALISGLLAALNWKLIVHAHYLNVDTIVTLVLTFAYFMALKYYERASDTKFTVLMGVFVGLAVGTKITALLTLPLFIYLFISKKDVRGMFAFLFIIFGVFVVTNPFSLIFANDFAFRVFMLSVKENGLVFDSADNGFFKYIFGLSNMVTLPVLLVSLIGVCDSLRKKKINHRHVFLIGTVLFYVIFYSIGTRRVDRWLLPILPIVFVYAAQGLNLFKEKTKPFSFSILFVLAFLTYLFMAFLLLFQFGKNTPKSEAYLWLRDNIDVSSNKLALTKEGLDPLNKLSGIFVMNYEVYESENAQFYMPENPLGYDYVILSSRPMEYTKSQIVTEKFPFYAQKWSDFEQQVLNEDNFVLIKSFTLPKPNLVELSDVYIYESVSYSK